MGHLFPRDVEEEAWRHALINAYKHGGRARAGAVVGKIIGVYPELKGRIKDLIGFVNKVVDDVNKLSFNEQRREIEVRWPGLLEKIEGRGPRVEKALPPLPNVDRYGRVRTRFSPNPDGPLHIGNARAVVLSHEYARIYKGSFILRFEDTSPAVKPPLLEAYDWIRQDLEWLEARPDEEYVQSSRLEIFYSYAMKLLEEGSAYVCNCEPKDFKLRRDSSQSCPCRNREPEEHIDRWERMVEGVYEEGEAVFRVKTDLDHPNPAVRDWPAFRIVDPAKHPHPLVGDRYRVWPLYNFSCGVDDHELKITHILRGKEHLVNTYRQRYLYKHLGWAYPEVTHFGRLKMERVVLSKSKIKDGLEKKLFKGLDDPRLGTLKALRRRGFKPEAIRRIIIDVGVKPVEATLSWDNVYAVNRQLLEPLAERYMFIQNPLTMKVKGVPSHVEAKVPRHPSYPEKGTRLIKLSPVNEECLLLISGSDLKLMVEGALVRLMGAFNVKIRKVGRLLINADFLSESYEDVYHEKVPIIQWVPAERKLPTEVIMPNADIIQGFSEEECFKLKPDTIIQFIRFGFVRIDQVDEGKLTAYFTHK